MSDDDDIPQDPADWVEDLEIETTGAVEVPERLIDQVIGQDEAVRTAKKAARQKRHLMMIGAPGTGKSMIAKAMTEILPETRLPDIVTRHNPKDPNQPRVELVEAGQGRREVRGTKEQVQNRSKYLKWAEWGLALGMVAFGLFWWVAMGGQFIAFVLTLFIAMFFLYLVNANKSDKDVLVPKLLIEHADVDATEADEDADVEAEADEDAGRLAALRAKLSRGDDEDEATDDGDEGPIVEPHQPPYVDATGAHAGALLGDIRHDPYQSGGLETPPHQRVEPGAIHRAHGGVLFIDEINTLRLPSQQSLLTAMQEGEYRITGQSESSSGSMVQTDPAPCDFVLVAAGNRDAVQATDATDKVATGGMHPALRSRIRGYGYEVYVNHFMPDTHDNRVKLLRFIAQEVERDGKIPHFDLRASAEIIREAQRRAGRAGTLTLRLRELGGLVRTAGDVARSEDADVVRLEHVLRAKDLATSLEQQITKQEIERSGANEALETSGELIGSAKAMAMIGTGKVGEPAGLVLPLEAAVSSALSESGGTITAGDALRDLNAGAVERIGPILKSLEGQRITELDIQVDAVVNHDDDDVDADGVGLAVAVSAISALEGIPVRQDLVMLGALSVSGQVRGTPGVTPKIEAAANVGYQTVVLPSSCRDDVLIEERYREQVELVYVDTLAEALDVVLADDPAREEIVERISA